MKVSFNELEARLKKAAKGAGLPWGLGEEFAKSLVWLAQRNVRLDAWVADFLKDQKCSDQLAGWAYELDLRAVASEPHEPSVGEYWVWLGFQGRLAKIQNAELDFETVRVNPVSLELFGHSEAEYYTQSAAPILRADVSSALWNELEIFEYKTYAPESEASRLKGAGAGVTDND